LLEVFEDDRYMGIDHPIDRAQIRGKRVPQRRRDKEQFVLRSVVSTSAGSSGARGEAEGDQGRDGGEERRVSAAGWGIYLPVGRVRGAAD
jgi:hypothetical protein